MKICLINNIFQPAGRGGAETVSAAIVDALLAAGHRVTVISTSPRTPIVEQETRFRIYRLGGLCSYFHELGRMNMVFRLVWHVADLFNLAAYFRLKKILLLETPEIVWTQNLMGIGYLAPFAIKAVRARHIHTLHDVQLIHPSGLMLLGRESRLDGLFARLYRIFTKNFFARVDTVISPSRWLMDQHLKRGFFIRSKRSILPNPLPFMSYQPKAEYVPLAGNITRFLCLGQIERHKGVLFLADAFNRWPLKSAELTIAGDGSVLTELMAYAERNPNLKLLNRLKREDALALLARSDCLIVPSLCYENFPTVILEAKACGIPVLAARIGGIPEMLSDDNSLFIPGDAADLTTKMRRMIDRRSSIVRAPVEMTDKTTAMNIADYIRLALG
jgi:glycosyltransferase involved in cell wall biosynthesis